MREHLPLRPIWLCRSCANPWPCGEARLRLTGEYADDRVALSVYMASMMGEAISDLHRLNPQPAPEASTMFGRFLAWTK
ncbi:hypothetical protein [Micromonospora rhizosphaerae]|uniref:hypothetical protein n=1 Tax=Micromonospora rhizosphaerae TaxID=568872 RepID=UPI000B897F92|nr:hypothetical protein [Micromonospora rhizosphaerae]